jgi:hypothetical protein
MAIAVGPAYRPGHGGTLPTLDDPDRDVNPLDAPAGIAVLLDEGRPPTVPGDGLDAVDPTLVDGAGVMNPPGAGALNVGEPAVGELIDGGVNVDVLGVNSVGDATDDDVAVDVPVLTNGRGGGLNGAAGLGKHGAGSVCMAGFGFATG